MFRTAFLSAVWATRVAAAYTLYGLMEAVSLFGLFDNGLSEALALTALDCWPGDRDLFVRP